MHINWQSQMIYMLLCMYHELMMNNINKVSDKKIKAMKDIEKDKTRVARTNKEVKNKYFQVEDLVWKLIYNLGRRSTSVWQEV